MDAEAEAKKALRRIEHGHAEGTYLCKCLSCGCSFMGAKLSVRCLTCADDLEGRLAFARKNVATA